MRFDDSWTVPVAPASLRAAAVDPARRAALDGGRVARGDAGGLVVTSAATVPTGARGFAVAVVGRELRLHRAERWSDVAPDGGVRLELAVTVADRPMRAAAVVELRPGRHPGESRCTVRGAATAELPGVRALVEKRLAAELLQALRSDLGAVADPAA